MRSLPFAGLKPHRPETSRRLWPQVCNRAGLSLHSGAQEVECRLEPTNSRSLVAEPDRDGAGNGNGIPANGSAATCRRDCLSKTAIASALGAGGWCKAQSRCHFVKYIALVGVTVRPVEVWKWIGPRV